MKIPLWISNTPHWFLFLALFVAWMTQYSGAVLFVGVVSWINVFFNTLGGSVMLLALLGKAGQGGDGLRQVVKTNSKATSKPNIAKLLHDGVFTLGLSGLFYHLDYIVLASGLVVSQVFLQVVMMTYFKKTRQEINESETNGK